MPLIEVRKLAAADMAWAGSRKILAEYVFGVILPLVLGLLSVRAALVAESLSTWELVLGIWLVGIAADYIPLALHAYDPLRRDLVEAEGRPELKQARRYGTQQALLLVPFVVLALAFVQQRRSAKTRV